jgi:hypothetical protein
LEAERDPQYAPKFERISGRFKSSYTDWFTTPIPVVGCECDWRRDLNFFGSLALGNVAA